MQVKLLIKKVKALFLHTQICIHTFTYIYSSTGGNVGQNYQTLTGEKLARITGLDPAGPLFFSSFPFPKINKNNAAFVDIIHTDEGDNGDISVDGDADFYPNDGIASQPGCNLTTGPC